MIKNLLIAFTAIVLLLASCKIKTHVHFNKDNSGTVSLEYDYSQYLAESEGTDSTGFLDSMAVSLQKLDTLGIMKRYKVSRTEKGILVTYAFDNPEQLNNSFNKFMDGDQQMERTTGKFTPSRNKMKYELVNPSKEKTEEEIVSSTDMEGLFDWEFKVSFEKKIKKCSNKNYSLEEDGHSMILKGSLSTFQDPEKMNFSVKLK